MKTKVSDDPDFINSKKTKYSLKEYKKHNPDPLHDHAIARLLCITPKEVQALYDGIVEKARKHLKIEVD